MRRLSAFFSGRVQGVGFRYTVERLARRAPVAGYVRNLRSGEVELVAEGEETELQEFLGEIRKAFESDVRDVKIKWGDATGEFQGFGIRF